jgi:hypothetical protein
MTAKADIPMFTALDHLKRELPGITLEQQEAVTKILAVFMQTLRRLIDPLASENEACMQAGPRCATCAFNPRTDSWPGFAPTAYGMLRATRDSLPFACHDNQPTWQKEGTINPSLIELCQGYKATTNYPAEVREAVAVTIMAIEAIVGFAPKIQKRETRTT